MDFESSLHFMLMADIDLEKFLQKATDLEAWEQAHVEWRKRNGCNWRSE